MSDPKSVPLEHVEALLTALQGLDLNAFSDHLTPRLRGLLEDLQRLRDVDDPAAGLSRYLARYQRAVIRGQAPPLTTLLGDAQHLTQTLDPLRAIFTALQENFAVMQPAIAQLDALQARVADTAETSIPEPLADALGGALGRLREILSKTSSLETSLDFVPSIFDAVHTALQGELSVAEARRLQRQLHTLEAESRKLAQQTQGAIDGVFQDLTTALHQDTSTQPASTQSRFALAQAIFAEARSPQELSLDVRLAPWNHALELATRAGDQASARTATIQLSLIFADLGEDAKVAQLFQELASLCGRGAGVEHAINACHWWLRAGQPEAAASALELATELADTDDYRPHIGLANARLVLAQKNLGDARMLLDGMKKSVDPKHTLYGEIRIVSGQTFRGLDRYDEALADLGAARRWGLDRGDRVLYAKASVLEVDLLDMLERREEALDRLVRVRATLLEDRGPDAVKTLDEIAQQLQSRWGTEQWNTLLNKVIANTQGHH